MPCVLAWLDYVSAAATVCQECGQIVREIVVPCEDILTTQDICLFIDVGPPAIPALIKLVHDNRWSTYYFRFPNTSLGSVNPSMRIGHLACYLIEAILREDPFFTHVGHLYYVQEDGTLERDARALEQAANAYERWYERCYDSDTQTITCSEEDLPTVGWRYAPDVTPSD